MIPLLAPFSISAISAEEFKSHVLSLRFDRRRIAKKEPAPIVSISRGKKGNPVIRVRRKPKWITGEELLLISRELQLPQSDTFILLKKKKIEVRSGT